MTISPDEMLFEAASQRGIGLHNVFLADSKETCAPSIANDGKHHIRTSNFPAVLRLLQ